MKSQSLHQFRIYGLNRIQHILCFNMLIVCRLPSSGTIDYLLCITKPFYKFTISLSKIKTTTIHNVFSVYNRLFSHFEQSIARLCCKRVPWKKAMLHALKAGIQKLSVYYKSTEEAHSSLYAIGTILAPQYKLKFFQTPEWQGEVEFKGDLSTWPEIYEKSLHHHLKEYSKHQPERQVLPSQRNAIVETEDKMTSLLAEDQPLIPPTQKVTGWQEELKRYLNLGAGVERLFSTARDICHYRRGSLNETTIQNLMMLRCLSQFDIKVESDEEI
ncbi:hypothetical protein N7541_000036 [Penicillium brevicompactum]|uniref:HAT C-terminal dimerisation domain-containing protein n=1 Tax=Penicillium brevicompactum TaxID=5074 RepID=A0A9W9RTH0_PENBR|nr:hypothetical protein N7541_000036 [Penicillium brevicompactum]